MTINKTGEDYPSLSTAEAALDNVGDLTAGTAWCGGYDNCTGTCDATAITDSEQVGWDGGASSGWMVHITATQYFILKNTGTDLADNDHVYDGESNEFDVAGTPDSCRIVMHLYDDDGDLSNAASIGGVTTDATNHWVFTAPAGERHDGTCDSGGATITSASPATIVADDDYTEISWIYIKNTSSDCITYGIDANDVHLHHVLMKTTGGGNVDDCVVLVRPNHIVENSVCCGADGAGLLYTSSAGGGKLYNFGSYKGGQGDTRAGIWESSNPVVDITAINTWSVDSGTVGDWTGTYHADSKNNASSDSTAPGTASVTNITSSDQFVDLTAGSEDLRLKSGSDLIDAGYDLGTTANEDIDGRDRDAEGDTWDIGFHEFVAAVSDWVPKFMGIY